MLMVLFVNVLLMVYCC